jgi:predicted nuclease of predicted toxin-antitoxin system
MKFVAGEGVDRQIVNRPREDGHSVFYAAESAPSSSDDEVLRVANESGALLLTTDKDFGELVYRMRRVHSGVVLIRLAGLTAEAKCEHVIAVLHTRSAELKAAFAVISPGSVRIRHSDS